MKNLLKLKFALLLLTTSSFAIGNNDIEFQEPKDDDPPIQEHISISLIYPNPVQNTLFLDPAVLERYSWLSIYSQTGSLVLEQEITESNTVNVDALSSGIYIVLLDGSECILSLMLVKQ